MFFNQSFWVAIALYASSAASFIFFFVGAIFFAISSFIFFIGGAIFFSRCWIKRLMVWNKVQNLGNIRKELPGKAFALFLAPALWLDTALILILPTSNCVLQILQKARVSQVSTLCNQLLYLSIFNQSLLNLLEYFLFLPIALTNCRAYNLITITKNTYYKLG